jgi:hypothetical protein
VPPEATPEATPPKNYGASLMVFTVDPQHGLPWLLLAREVAGKWCGGGSTFSDFGGGADPADVDAEATAAREFTEESLFCVDVPGMCGPLRARSQQLAAQLRAGDYMFRVNFPVKHKNAVYSMFVKQVAWQSDITTRFKFARRRLLSLRYSCAPSAQDRHFMASHPAFHTVGTKTLLRRQFLEKVNIELFSIAGLRRYLQFGRHNLLKDMHLMPRMRGNVRTACALIESAFDSMDGAAQVRCNALEAPANFPASHKQLPATTDSEGYTHVGLCKKKIALRVFATEPHAAHAAPWDRTDYARHAGKTTTLETAFANHHLHHRATAAAAANGSSNWNWHFRKRNQGKHCGGGGGSSGSSGSRSFVPTLPTANSSGSSGSSGSSAAPWPTPLPMPRPRPRPAWTGTAWTADNPLRMAAAATRMEAKLGARTPRS